MPHAILFDLGSTLWDDYPAELHYWQQLTGLLRQHGIETSLPELVDLSEQVIATYCPSLTRSMVFKLVGGHMGMYRTIIDELQVLIKERFADPQEFRRLNPLFPGIHEMLENLARQYPLGVVSQNFAEAQQWMKFHDLDMYFSAVSLSDKEQLYKPDPRLFLHACQALDVEPRQTVMVGDRLDNDIWPANRLHMTSVRVLADPYRIQQPRYHNDIPCYTLERTCDLEQVVPL